MIGGFQMDMHIIGPVVALFVFIVTFALFVLVRHYAVRYAVRYRLYRSCGFNRRASLFGCASLDARMNRLWFPLLVLALALTID